MDMMKSVTILTFLSCLMCENVSLSKGEVTFVHYWYNISSNRSTFLLLNNVKNIMETERHTYRPGSVITEKSNYHRKLVSKRLQSFLPPFAVTSNSVSNEQCKQDSRIFLRALDDLEMWALKMHDSSGKLPSGLLNGNVNQLGDFDGCLSSYDGSSLIQGQYCLAYLQITQQDKVDATISHVLDLVQSHFVFKSKLSDPGHRVPRFSTINWALCVPSSCSNEDVQIQLTELVERFSNNTGLDVEIMVDAEMCNVKKTSRLPLTFWFASLIFASVLVVSLVATGLDLLEKSSANSALHCFSLKRNCRQLISVSRPSDDIESVHGVRMINALMLLLSHKSMALFFSPYSNRTYMSENLGRPWTVLARAASLYTDPFIMISGLLTSYSFLKTLRKNGHLDIKKEYSNRLIRIVPMMAAVILFCTFILPEIGSGPQWNLTVTHHAEKCKTTWWKNFLFIHNYFGFENMCLTHTHHLGIDTQLFLVSPLLVQALFKSPLLGGSCLVGLAAVSTAVRYQATLTRHLSYFIYPGSSVSQMFDTADYSYILPFHRLTVYIMGILLGALLFYTGRCYKLKTHILRLGWSLALAAFYYSYIKPSAMGDMSYVYNQHQAAAYAALAPIAWCFVFGWIIFASHIGRGGWVGRVFSSKHCMIWTRLSYAIYLAQFPLFFYNIGRQRSSQEYSITLLVNFFELIGILAASVTLTVLFDFPFNNLKKILGLLQKS